MALKSLIAAGAVGQLIREMTNDLASVANGYASSSSKRAKLLDQTKLAGCVVPDTAENQACLAALLASVPLPSDEAFGAVTDERFSKEDCGTARQSISADAVAAYILSKLADQLPINDV